MIGWCGLPPVVHNEGADDVGGARLMSVSIDELPISRAMPWDEFWAIPEEFRAEYVDGVVYVNPPATYRHQKICQGVRDQVLAAFGKACVVAVATGWQLPTRRRILRIPDLMLLDREPEGDIVTGPIPVAVEVTSRNRARDVVLKAGEYLEAGAGQYWLVDPKNETITVFGRSDDGWSIVAEATGDTPTIAFNVPPFGEINLSLSEILG
jgi:Uma2 family endonuclease